MRWILEQRKQSTCWYTFRSRVGFWVLWVL